MHATLYVSHIPKSLFPPLIGVGKRLAIPCTWEALNLVTVDCVYMHMNTSCSAALRVETVNTLEAMTLNQRNAAQQEKENAELQKKIIEAQEVLKQQEIQRKNESEMVQKCNTVCILNPLHYSLFLLPMF